MLKSPHASERCNELRKLLYLICRSHIRSVTIREYYFIPVRSLQATVSFDVYVKIGHTAHSLEAVGVCPKKEAKGEVSEVLIQNRQQLGQLSAG